jgi:peptidoglycan/xylan/chitin deacetylase (PgdA/CDA1 family)
VGVRRVGPRVVALVISLAAGAFIAAPAAAGAVSASTGGAASASAAAAARAASGTAAASGQRGTRPARTVVTFAWGGGSVTQMQALPVFRHYGVHATFFIPSGLVCTQSPAECARTSPYLTRPDLGEIAADGNEIGGLTVLHQQLNTVPSAEARREVCDDRSNLMRWGFQPTDFAYPFAVENPAVEQIVRRCGYNAGLGAGDVRGVGRCLRCAVAETIPPANPMNIRAPLEVNSAKTAWSLRTYQLMVRDAQAHGGGWLVFLIHDVCSRTCAYGTTTSELGRVLGWLRSQRGHGVRVATMRQVIGGPVHPAVAGPAPPKLPAAGLRNATLAAKAGGGYPVCYQGTSYGRNTATFRYQPSGGPHGMAAETLQVTNWSSGDAKLLPAMDLGRCAPAVTAGRRYQLSAQYRATLPTQFDVYYRTGVGDWRYWTTSVEFPASPSWTKATWTTPAVPAGATAISFGLVARSDGTISTTGYRLAPATSHRTWILLGVGVAVLIGAGMITRGHLRYKRYVAATARPAAPPEPGASAPAAPAAPAGGDAGQPGQAKLERPAETADSPAPGGQPGA